VLSHDNYRQVVDIVLQGGLLEGEDLTYLYLPLAHSFALLIQIGSYDSGCTLAYFGGDTKQIVTELNEVRPTYLPSVPRIFEKIYTLVTANGDPAQVKAATQVGLKVRELQRRARRSRGAPSSTSTRPRSSCSRTSARRSAAGCARPSRAPRRSPAGDPRVLLRVRRPRARGLRHDRDRHRGDVLDHRGSQVRHGRRLLPGVEGRIAEDGELLLKGPNIFQGYYR
jgi:long-chain acyl-CoA synthetase